MVRGGRFKSYGRELCVLTSISKKYHYYHNTDRQIALLEKIRALLAEVVSSEPTINFCLFWVLVDLLN